MIKLNIVCVKWGTKYGAEYVNRLYAAVQRHTTVEYQFHCYTDDSDELHPDVIVHDLPCVDLEGWWNKMYLFNCDNGLTVGEQIFYIDLDTLITGNIDHMLQNLPDHIVMLQDFYHGIAKSAGKIASGLMTWRHGDYHHIWEQFIRDPNQAIASVRPHGDQHYIASQITQCAIWQELYPGQVVSFKVHCREGLPDGAKIICYHGTPNIPDSAEKVNTSYVWTIDPQPWVLDHWRD
jgi:hypothetical protein